VVAGAARGVCDTRATWDQHVGGLNVVLATFRAKGISFVPPLPSVLIFAKQLLFFHRPSCDRDRVVTLAALLLASSAAPDPSKGFLGALEGAMDGSDDGGPVWARAFLAARLCAVALCHATSLLSSSVGPSSSGGESLAPLCAVVDTLTSGAAD